VREGGREEGRRKEQEKVREREGEGGRGREREGENEQMTTRVNEEERAGGNRGEDR